jgi:general secretion pathway protein I
MRINSLRRLTGFTLLEVLVALAIIAISLSAAINAVSSATNTATYLKQKTFAEWVAMNKVAEMRLRHDWPAIGRSNGTAQMSDITWKWTMEVKNTPDQSVRRLEVSVQPESQREDAATAMVVAFLGKPS